MDTILGRTQFLSQTANLFTDEKTVNARARVVEWLNDLPVAESTKKCELLVKIQETVVVSCIELLEEFLEHILSLAYDTNVEVRKQVVFFIEQICKAKVEFIGQVVNIVSMLLRDRAPQVIKRVIQACGSIYKNGLQWICSQEELTDSAEQAWTLLSLIKVQIFDMIDNDNDGIRTNAIKFLEGVIVLQSYPDEDSQKKENDYSLADISDRIKIIKRNKLEEEAFYIFDLLLKFHAATHISSVNLIACTSSLCTISKLRPSFMGPVVEAYKNLNSNLPPTLTDSQISSVRKSLKMQLFTLLKHKSSYEFQVVIRHILLDLGASTSEIQKAIPKMSKQEQLKRQKRILENASNLHNKRMRFNSHLNSKNEKESSTDEDTHMEIDLDEMQKQSEKSTKVNEKFISENLRTAAVVVNLIFEHLPRLPDKIPEHFITEYTPIRDMTISQQITKISHLLANEMTIQKIGPGSAAFSKVPPMKSVKRNRTQLEETEFDALTVAADILEEDQLLKEDSNKKLKESVERLKGEQEVIERMKQKAKTLKLQEITKSFTRPIKEKFLMDAVERILHSERQCLAGGVSAKRRHILTVVAATFPDNVRYHIFEFIMKDIKQRIDLAFSWMYEEYCLLQGFTRHSYVKSENRPDYAYNEFIKQLVKGISEKCEFRDKIILLKRVFLEAPLLPADVIKFLQEHIQLEDYGSYGLELLKDLIICRPPRRNKFLRILWDFSMHNRNDLRQKAYEHLVSLYNEHKLMTTRIEELVLEWVNYITKDTPPVCIFTEDYGRTLAEMEWNEDTIKICLTPLLILMPYNSELYLDKLAKVYSVTSPEVKRSILKTMDEPIKKLGVTHPILLKLIEDCPKGCETLIIRIIYILTARETTADSELVNRVKHLYKHKVKDVRILIPILSGLSRKDILDNLPKMIKMNPIVVKEVFNRLLKIGNDFVNQTISTSPTDILVALHTIEINECDLKNVVKATSICLNEKDVYTQDVLTGVLQELVEITPIPTLLMRTIIQSLTLYPRIGNLVLNLLQRLILKQVWRQKVIWEGFLKCVQRLQPASMSILLQLPPQHLINSLEQCPDLRKPLLEYAHSIEDEPMAGITPKIMDIITGKNTDVFITDDSGGYITLTNIKREAEDPQEISAISTLSPVPILNTRDFKVNKQTPVKQPLPPGED